MLKSRLSDYMTNRYSEEICKKQISKCIKKDQSSREDRSSRLSNYFFDIDHNDQYRGLIRFKYMLISYIFIIKT